MSVPHYPNYHGFKTSNIVLLQEFLNNFWPFTVPFEFYFIFLFASLYWRVPHPHGTTGKPETWQVLQLQQEAWKGKGLTCGLATPSWKKLWQTDRQTGWGGELTSLLVLSPLPPLEKKVKHWLCSTPSPQSNHMQHLWDSSGQVVPRGSFPLFFLHFGLLGATQCPLPSFTLSPSPPNHQAPTQTFPVISRASLPQGFWDFWNKFVNSTKILVRILFGFILDVFVKANLVRIDISIVLNFCVNVYGVSLQIFKTIFLTAF